MTDLVFLHNHLAHGGKHHDVVGDRLFAGRATVKGVVFILDDDELALAVRGGGDAWVPGELYYGDDELLSALDGIHGADYVRRRRQVRVGSDGPMVDAWLWTWDGDWTGKWKGRDTLPGGCTASAHSAAGHTTYYYGYASNMFRFGERRELTVYDMRLGHIDDWQVAFAKDSQQPGKSYVTILPKRDGIVRGALYRMPNSEMEASLDPQEKEGRHLERKTYAVIDDTTGKVVWGDIYRTLPRWWIWGNISHPSNTEKIVGGAKEIGIDADYVAWLEKFVDVPADPDEYDFDLHTLTP